jgi:hypothetical protein
MTTKVEHGASRDAAVASALTYVGDAVGGVFATLREVRDCSSPCRGRHREGHRVAIGVVGESVTVEWRRPVKGAHLHRRPFLPAT